MRYINVMVGGLIAGLGGAWFTLEAVDVFNPRHDQRPGVHRPGRHDLRQVDSVRRA